MCIRCAEPAVFDANLRQRKPLPGELAEGASLSQEHLRWVQAAIRQVNASAAVKETLPRVRYRRRRR